MDATTWTIAHPLLGEVEVRARADCRRFTGRWKDGRVRLTIPAGVSEAGVRQALEVLAPRLLSRQPLLDYSPGTTISLPGFTFRFLSQSLQPTKLLLKDSGGCAYLSIGTAFDPAVAANQRIISKAMCVVARRHASELLLPRAQQIAKALGVEASAWEVSRGHRILGHCSASGVIALSYVNVFLPQPLRDYIVCHELAHLDQMNHGPRFHALADKYMQGHEAELRRRLARFQWPILRN